MGSPVFVVIVNLVMKDVEEGALTTFHSPSCFWKRYVDDTCTALPRDMVKSFHSHLNSIEPCIQFMVEKESEDRMLSFLDVELCRDSDRTITTSVYRKTTHVKLSCSGTLLCDLYAFRCIICLKITNSFPECMSVIPWFPKILANGIKWKASLAGVVTTTVEVSGSCTLDSVPWTSVSDSNAPRIEKPLLQMFCIFSCILFRTDHLLHVSNMVASKFVRYKAKQTEKSLWTLS